MEAKQSGNSELMRAIKGGNAKLLSDKQKQAKSRTISCPLVFDLWIKIRDYIGGGIYLKIHFSRDDKSDRRNHQAPNLCFAFDGMDDDFTLELSDSEDIVLEVGGNSSDSTPAPSAPSVPCL